MNPVELKRKKAKENLVRTASFIAYFGFMFPINLWAVACSDIFSNGIQATSASGNVNLSFHSIITGGSATLRTVTLTDAAGWVACSGSSCAASGTAAITSAPAFVTGTGTDGNISVANNGNANYSSGDYGTVTVGQQGTLKFNDNNGIYKTRTFTTNFKSEVWLREGDYWINGNLTLGQETILRRNSSPSGSTRIFVNGNVSMGYKVSTSSFNSNQLLIYATGTITSANEVNLSAFVYGGGNVSFGYRSVINGAVSGNNFTASGNEVTVNYQPSALTSAVFSPFCSGVAATVDHYELQVANKGVACVGVDVTVRACANSTVPCTVASTISGNVTLATSAGTLNATTLTLASGQATTKLKNAAATDGSVTTVTLSGETTSALNLRKCCTSATSCTTANSCAITFNTAGFIFSNNATTVGDIPTEIAGVTDSLVYLRAIQSNTSTGACTARFTSAQDVLLAYQCRNPTTCIVGQTLSLNGSAIQSNANAVGTISYSTVSLNFNSQGTIAIPLNYSDVGQIRLFASLTRAATANDPAFTLTGTSNDFVVKPSAFAISSVQTASNVNNPATTNSGAGFVTAGEKFKVSIQARNALGNPTPNFGNEILSEKSKLTLAASSLVYPTGGTLTALSDEGLFIAATPGTFVNTDISWSQAGSIVLLPGFSDVTGYLSAGSSSFIPSGTVGRFYPDHYRVVSSSIINSCNSFTYMNQPMAMNYLLQAEALNGTALVNYDNTNQTQFYAPSLILGPNMAQPRYQAENNNLGNGDLLDARVLVPATNWDNGALTLNTTSAFFSRKLAMADPDGPFSDLQIGMSITDSLDNRSLQNLNMDSATAPACGAACTAVSLGTPLNLRYGRLRLDDAFGPETVALPVHFVTEYWTGNNFALNTIDSCTVIPRAAITYPNGTLTLDSNRTISLSSGITQGVYSGLDAVGVSFNAGTVLHSFSKPSVGGTGSFVVGIDLTSLTWLRYDWNQDLNYSDTSIPNARFSFGSYRGNDRIIYWREKLQ
ncbi:MAG: DUF6701 domain-containing protein [Pseudomonadota bacterium]